MIVAGIDPGITGAIAVIDTNEDGWLEVHDMPTSADKAGKNQVSGTCLAGILREIRPDKVVLEKVNAMPGRPGKPGEASRSMGATSAFNFGRGYGTILGVVQALGIPLEHAPPATWKKAAGIQGTAKDYARTRARDLYPDAPLDRKKDIGRADAILIARFG